MHPWYVWHALRACALNSNGTTDPQLGRWQHPSPSHPSVLLCTGKHEGTEAPTAGETHEIHPVCAHRSPSIMCVISLWDANNIIVLGTMAACTTWLQYMIIMSLHLFIFPVWAGQPRVWSAGPAQASRRLIILLKWRSLVLGRLPRLIYSPEKPEQLK